LGRDTSFDHGAPPVRDEQSGSEPMLATSSFDGLRLYDIARGQLVAPIIAQTNDQGSVAFTYDGHLVLVDTAGKGCRLPVTTPAWKRRSCHIAGGPLTAAESRRLLPARAYRSACARASAHAERDTATR
jgi:hypothetical protein